MQRPQPCVFLPVAGMQPVPSPAVEPCISSPWHLGITQATPGFDACLSLQQLVVSFSTSFLQQEPLLNLQQQEEIIQNPLF